MVKCFKYFREVRAKHICLVGFGSAVVRVIGLIRDSPVKKTPTIQPQLKPLTPKYKKEADSNQNNKECCCIDNCDVTMSCRLFIH